MQHYRKLMERPAAPKLEFTFAPVMHSRAANTYNLFRNNIRDAY